MHSRIKTIANKSKIKTPKTARYVQAQIYWFNDLMSASINWNEMYEYFFVCTVWWFSSVGIACECVSKSRIVMAWHSFFKRIVWSPSYTYLCISSSSIMHTYIFSSLFTCFPRRAFASTANEINIKQRPLLQKWCPAYNFKIINEYFRISSILKKTWSMF